MKAPRKVVTTIRTELDDFGRKKFTLQEESESQEIEPDFLPNGRYQSTLLRRQTSLNIEKYVGRIDKNRKKANREVFFCEVCKEGFKCDLAYIAHCNSPSHNRILGMNMKVKAVPVSAVTMKLEALRRQADQSRHEKQDKSHSDGQNQQDEKQQNEPPQPQKSQEEQDDTELLLREMGLPTSFGKKKQKR